MNLVLILLIISEFQLVLITPFQIGFAIKNNFIISSVYIGTPLQSFTLLMDTGSPFLWVGNSSNLDPTHNNENNTLHTYNETLSSTIKEYNSHVVFHRGNHSVEGVKVTDFVTLFSNTGQFTASTAWALVHQLDSIHSEFDGVFGFLRDQSVLNRKGIDDFTNYNYIDVLYQENKIKHKTLGFQFTSNSSGWITIGDINLAKDIDTCSSDTMPIEERLGAYWYCQITSMQFELSKKTIELSRTGYALFVTGERKINGPVKESMEIFEEYVRLSNNECRIENKNTDDGVLICLNKKSIELLEPFEVSFGTVSITVDPLDLFEYRNGEYYFLMKFLPHDFLWVFGEQVLRNYDTVFDYSKKTVSFVKGAQGINFRENINNESEKERKTAFSKICIGIVVIISLILISLLIFRKIRKGRLLKKTPGIIDMNNSLLTNQTELGLKRGNSNIT